VEHFHSLNIRQNRNHYSGLARFGSPVVASIQEDFGAGIYYNPFVKINGLVSMIECA
jgi:translocator assembly and maintenance protein 41